MQFLGSNKFFRGLWARTVPKSHDPISNFVRVIWMNFAAQAVEVFACITR